MANSLADDPKDLPHFTFPEEPLGLPAAEGFGYFQGGPGTLVGAAGRYAIQAKLGYGTTSSVWLARDNIVNKHVAIKVLTGCATQYNREEKLEELAVFRRLDAAPAKSSDHCATLFEGFVEQGAEEDGQHLFLVMELFACNIEDVQKAIGDGFIPPKTVKRILKHVLLGIARLHEHGIVHTDIKPDNVMVALGDSWTTEAIDAWVKENPPRTWPPEQSLKGMVTVYMSQPLPPPPVDALASCDFKLADYSNAQFVDDQTTDDITPMGLRPPEVVLRGEWNQSVDIWTFGCLVFTLLTRRPLFKPMDAPELNASAADVLLFQMVLFCGESFTQEFLQRCPSSADHFNADGSHKKFKVFPMKPFKKCILDSGCVLSPEDMEGVTDLMAKCLRLDPKDRATAQELLTHPWWDL